MIILAGQFAAPGAARAQVTTEELQREITQRDALIQRLIKRVDALEHAAHAGAAAAPKPVVAGHRQTRTAPPSSTAARNAPPVQLGNAPPSAVIPAAPEAAPSAAIPAAPEAAPSAVVPASTAQGPSDQEIARALENTLINQGGLLLAPWVMQLVPDFGGTYSSLNQLAYVAPGIVPGTTSTGIYTQRSHQWDLEWGLSYRVGLPYGMQAFIRVPVDWAQGEATFAGTTGQSSTASGIGDVSFGLQKQVLYEDSVQPSVILNVSYKAATGSSSLAQPQVSTFPFAVGTGSGFATLSGGIAVQKRQDPLAFLANFQYYHNFSATLGGINQKLGDVVEMRFATILAASPDTDLNLAWDTFFQQDETVGGQMVKGTNQTVSYLELGAGSNLSARWFMDASVGIGLTHDSPDFRVLLQFPYRF